MITSDIGQLVLTTMHVDGTYVALIKTVFAVRSTHSADARGLLED
jgi:hypothetical protein